MGTMTFEEFKKTDEYKEFQKNFPNTGKLKVQVYTAQQAIPVSGVKITVICDATGKRVEFFSGYTDESGIIDDIELPAPLLDEGKSEVPKCLRYKVIAEYANLIKEYDSTIYAGIKTLQLINLFPSKINELTNNMNSGL